MSGRKQKVRGRLGGSLADASVAAAKTKSDIAYNFIAIDFETANYSRTSACSIGLAIVKNGIITETFSALIRPEPFWFIPEFTELHGISEAEAGGAKKFSELWPELASRIEGRSLLAHNAPFDRSVLKACLQFYNIKFPQPDFICSCRISKAALPEYENHKLNTVCSRLGIALDHHQAESDAVACAKVALSLCSKNKSLFSRGLLRQTDW